MFHVSTVALAPAVQSQADIAVSALNPTTESTYAVAAFLLNMVDKILKPLGLSGNDTVETIVYAGLVFLVSIAVGYVAKWLILGAMRKFGEKVAGDLYGFLRDENFFSKLCTRVSYPHSIYPCGY